MILNIGKIIQSKIIPTNIFRNIGFDLQLQTIEWMNFENYWKHNANKCKKKKTTNSVDCNISSTMKTDMIQICKRYKNEGDPI